MKVKVVPFFMAILLFYSYSFAGGYTPIDPSGFDIGGVKLGMSLIEAERAVVNYYGVPKDSIKHRMNHIKNEVTGKEEVSWFNVKIGETKLTVYFTIRIPLDPERQLVVYYVHMELPYSKQNHMELRKAAFEKYGQPSNQIYPLTSSFKWCMEQHNDYGVPNLKLGNNKLMLQDYSYHEAFNKYRAELKTVKPKI